MSKEINREYEFNGEELIAAADEGLRVMQAGKLHTLRSRTLTVPPPAKAVAPKEIRAIRLHLRVSQAVFARILNVSTRTIVDWESGRRRPSGTAVRLLKIAQKRPEVLVKAIYA